MKIVNRPVCVEMDLSVILISSKALSTLMRFQNSPFQFAQVALRVRILFTCPTSAYSLEVAFFVCVFQP